MAGSLSSQQCHSMECTGMEENIDDCIWTVKEANPVFKDAIVLCSEGMYHSEFLCNISSVDAIIKINRVQQANM